MQALVVLAMSSLLRADDPSDPDFVRTPIRLWLRDECNDGRLFADTLKWGLQSEYGFSKIREMGEAAVPDIVDVLEGGQFEGRFAAVEAARRLGPNASAAVPALVALLKDADRPLHRSLVCTALEEIGLDAAEAHVELREVLSDHNEAPDLHGNWVAWVGDFAAAALARLGPEGVTDLCAALRDGPPEVQRTALQALRAAKPYKEIVLPALHEALRTPDVELRSRVIQAISDLADSGDAFGDVAELLRDQSAYEEWVHFGTVVITIRRNTFDALMHVRPSPRQEILLRELLLDEDPELRQMAKLLLCRMQPPPDDAVAAAHELLRDTTEETRMLAAITLGESRAADPDVFDGLIEATQYHDDFIAAHALHQLGRAGAPGRRATSLLQRIAAGQDETTLLNQNSARLLAVVAILRLGQDDDAIRAALLQEVDETFDRIWDGDQGDQRLDEFVWQDMLFAIRTLPELRAPVARVLCRFFDTNSVPERSLAAAAVLGDDGVVVIPRIHASLLRETTSVETRQIGLRMLGLVGRNVRYAVVDDLCAFLKSGPVADRAIAARALGDLGGNDAATIEKLTQALDDRFATMRVAACDALGMLELAAEPALPRLRELEHDPHAAVRYAARKAVERIGDRE
jgi:HEAT repeat protein